MSGNRADEDAVVDEAFMDFTMEELRDFLEADLVDVRADPEFKERLRRQLWKMVQAQSRREPGPKP